MGFLGGLVKAAVNIVTLPVAIVADVVTLGGAETTGETMENIGANLEEAGDGLTGNDDFI
jgi:hypothetical protein